MMCPYFPPAIDPWCRCTGDRVRAARCETGHLQECHWPWTCSEAGCAFLDLEGYDRAGLEDLRDWVLGRLLALARPDCRSCGGGGVVQIKARIREAYPNALGQEGNERVYKFFGPCNCVRGAAAGLIELGLLES